MNLQDDKNDDGVNSVMTVVEFHSEAGEKYLFASK